MSITLDDLTTRLEAAQKRLEEANQKLAFAQKVQQYAQYEVNTWTAAVNIETQREEARLKASAIQANTTTNSTASSSLQSASVSNKPTAAEVVQPQDSSDTNKTEMIRQLLRQSATGLTPSDLWKQVKGQFNHRPYLYSVLKRLKDRDEVTVRRGKYLLKTIPKVEEQKTPNSTIVQ